MAPELHTLENRFQKKHKLTFDYPPLSFETNRDQIKKLRSKHETERLSGEEALELIMLGNMEHVSAIRPDNTPLIRYEKILHNKADFLLVKCSDSRIPPVDSETNKAVYLTVSIAGNVIPSDRSLASFDELVNMSYKVDKEKGTIVCLGHCKCGALHAYSEYLKARKEGHQPKLDSHLSALFSSITKTDPSENAIDQAEKAQKATSRKVGAMVFDWFAKAFLPLKSGDKFTDGKVEKLADSLNQNNETFENEQKLKKHKPHTTIIGSEDLPFSPSAITKGHQNEVFTTTGSKNGLDDLDLASIFYSVEHLGVRHLAFIAPTTESDTDLAKIDALFTKWHSDLHNASNPNIRVLIDRGELTISTMHYNLKDGKLEQCRFFSNTKLSN